VRRGGRRDERKAPRTLGYKPGFPLLTRLVTNEIPSRKLIRQQSIKAK
jgi:hypothetical protein